MGTSVNRSIYIGYDPREEEALLVARHSIQRHLRDGERLPIRTLRLSDLRQLGLYTRPTTIKDGHLYDTISDAPMSTEFAISRFFVPYLAQTGWSLFMDCDMLVTTDLVTLFELVEAHPDKALFCVHHRHEPRNDMKMDGQVQTRYARKNWSSVMLFNCDHPSNNVLRDISSTGILNSLPGRDLHRFSWLLDDEIGELPLYWNYLVGYNHTYQVPGGMPGIIHYTSGGPWFAHLQDVEFADPWWDERRRIES